MLTPRDEDAVRREFAKLAGPVKLVVFSQELAAAELCRQNEMLVREVSALSDKLSVEVLNLDQPVDELIPVGLTNRPELATRQAFVQATLARLRQERIRSSRQVAPT